jgi:antitoxin FitA
VRTSQTIPQRLKAGCNCKTYVGPEGPTPGCHTDSEARAYTIKTPLNGRFASDASNAIIADMATLTIRQLDQKTKTRLRVRAAHHGRSMEEEAREILRSALTTTSRTNGNLAETIRRRFAPLGGIELSLPKRDAVRKAPGFEE